MYNACHQGRLASIRNIAPVPALLLSFHETRLAGERDPQFLSGGGENHHSITVINPADRETGGFLLREEVSKLHFSHSCWQTVWDWRLADMLRGDRISQELSTFLPQ